MAVASYQMLVRGLDGKTSCLQFSHPTVAGSLLYHRVADLLGIPSDCLHIVTGTREISHNASLSADCDGIYPSCSLLLRLRGGKGGFGSLLRGAATKAGQKKTSNFDACRDMSGRRLRHVNAEKKLKEWKAQAKERELEKAAQAFIKKQVKQKQVEADYSQDILKFREETSRAREDVASAVASGLAEAKVLGKRKVVEDAPASTKRACAWLTEVVEESDDEMIEDEGDDKIAVGDGRDGHGSHETGEDNIQEEEDKDKVLVSVNAKEAAAALPSQDTVENKGSLQSSDSSLRDVSEESSSKSLEVAGNMAKVEHSPDALSEVSLLKDADQLSAQEQLNFNNYDSSRDMEVLGLERLKHELQSRGLKCGGSLAERAARLFLLKTCSLEKLDKKHFAKTKGGDKQ